MLRNVSNSLKRQPRLFAQMCLKIDFKLLSGLVVKIWGEFRRVGIRPILSKKAWAIAHGFKNGGFNSADFEQKAWAIAHGFGGFG